MSNYEVERWSVEGLTVKVMQDTHVEDPRAEFDHLGIMVCWHKRATLGDGGYYARKGMERYKFSEPQDYYEWRKLTEEDGDPVVVELPLSLYEHSGMTMWAGKPGEGPPGTNCPWDSGQVGYIFATRKAVQANWSRKRMTKWLLEQTRKALESEVKEYDQFLRGEVYGYVIEDPDGETLDSCWGFYGFDYVKGEAEDAAKGILAEREKERAEELEKSDGA